MSSIQYVYQEPSEYTFKNRDGHDGKLFGTNSKTTNHLIIECREKLTVALTQQKSEFNYYIIEGNGFFMLNDVRHDVTKGNLIVIPPGTKYSFGGQLKMLLINTPPWSADQELVEQQ